jgi:hypothetical protein
MTPKEAAALARRAVACSRWRWMPGMVTTYGQRIARVDADGYAVAHYRGGHLQMPEAGALPNLTDPATLGCLLVLVRQTHGAAAVVYLPRDGAIRCWRVVTFAHGAEWLTPARLLGEGATEAEALVAALEAAP